jgi:serine/threonine-protein kinase HipA
VKRAFCRSISSASVGHLLEEQDIWTLRYDALWSRSAQAFDLSPALPRHQLEHRDGSTVRTVQWFFDNLLPEEHLREAICREANVRDAFDVLRYLGRESAGALSLLPPGEALPTDSAIVPLPDDALVRRIRNLPQQTLIRDAPKKMSAAGAQHNCCWS